MQALVDILKSRGKIGGWILILLGLGDFVGIAIGKITFSSYIEASAMLAAGLGIVGIRGAMTPPATPPAA